MDALASLESRRFGGTVRLFGAEGAARLRAAHVLVAGVGGVGSWAVEALARAGVGRITLVDLDHVAESNLNRQLHATCATLGMAKVEAMRERVALVAPDCLLETVDDFVTPDNVAALLGPGIDLAIDAVDDMAAKVALVAHCRRQGMPLVVCGAAGGRIDALRLREEDLARCTGDALLAKLRGRLRREHGFPPAPPKGREAKRFGVTVVFSDEQPVRLDACETGTGGAPLGCAGYGSLVSVTAAMGMAAAGIALRRIARGI